MQKFYTPKNVASLLNVSEFTVRKWIRQGKIEDTFKFGHKTIRIPDNSLQKFLSKNKEQG